jgi:hypothetical protein
VIEYPYANCPFGGFTDDHAHNWLNGTDQWDVFAHEFGHSLGMQHAGRLYCVDAKGNRVSFSKKCTIGEYSDNYDVMGSGETHISAWHKFRLGVIPKANVTTVKSSGTYRLRDAQHAVAAGDGVQMIRVPHLYNSKGSVQEYLTLEYDVAYGTFEHASDIDGKGIVVRLAPHFVPTLNGGSEIQLLSFSGSDVLSPGHSFTDFATGVKIQTISVDKHGAVVKISVPGH